MSDDGLWDIPKTWTWSKAEDFSVVVGGGTPHNAKDSSNYDLDGTPWITPADLSEYRETYIERGRRDLSEKGFKSSSARLMPKGTVLLSSRAPVGYCAVASGPISTNQGFKSFVLDDSALVPEYIRYYLLASKRYLESESSGTTFLELSGGRAKELLFPIAPGGEQKRIVSRIDQLFSSIDEGERALDRVRKLVERYRQSVLKAAVTGELTREWREQQAGELESGEALLTRILEGRRKAWEAAELAKMTAKNQRPADDYWKERYKEPEHPDTGGLPELPSRWVWASVDQLCKEFGNGLSRKPSHEPPGTPILRISAVRQLAVDPSDVRYYVAESNEHLDKSFVVNGDILFTRYNGSRELVGISGVYEGTDQVLYPDKLIRARVVSESAVVPAYLALALNTGFSAARLASLVKTSAGQHGISGSDIKHCPVPLPPLREQLKIADLYRNAAGKCGDVLSSVKAERQRSTALRQTVLKTAFEGNLVSQKTTDEPASLLLERIAAKRAATASVVFATKEQSKRRFPAGMTIKRATKKATARKGKAKA